MIPEPQSGHPTSPAQRTRWRRYFRGWSISDVLTVLLAVYLVIGLSVTLDGHQWDFTTYYYAGTVSASGGDVYNIDVPRNLSGGYVHPYLYPPMAARLFRPLAGLTHETARQIWYWLHVVALILLFWIWRRFFVTEGRLWPFLLLAIFGFSDSVYLDLKAGNVTLFEQVLLWSGFVCLLKKRVVLFCVLVVVASALKGFLLLFLAMLFLLPVERRWRYVIGSVTAFGATQLIDFLIDPSAYTTFVTRALTWDERGAEFNPSFLAMFKDIGDYIIKKGFPSGPGVVLEWAFYAAVAVTVGLVSWRLIRRTIDAQSIAPTFESKVLGAIVGMTLAFGLVAPRYKVYAFMMALPAVYLVIRRHAQMAAVGLAVILAGLTTHTFFPVKSETVDYFWWYYPIFSLALFWGIWVAGSRAEMRSRDVINLPDPAD